VYLEQKCIAQREVWRDGGIAAAGGMINEKVNGTDVGGKEFKCEVQQPHLTLGLGFMAFALNPLICVLNSPSSAGTKAINYTGLCVGCPGGLLFH
jgi:hypothetical protein